MREFEYTFTEGFVRGLRTEENNPINSEALVELKNARPTALGLMPYEPISLPYSWRVLTSSPAVPTSLDVIVDWPFPQYFHTSYQDLLAYRNKLSGVSGTGTQTDLFNVLSSDLWEFANLQRTALLVKDGTFVAERDYLTGAWTKHAPHAQIPYAKTLINLNGQLIAGNLSLWGGLTSLDENFIAWSKIGEMEFGINAKNTSGFRHSWFNDGVVTIKKLRSSCVIYGYDGVAVVTPVGEPAATFAYNDISSLGVFSKGSVGVGLREHCFVGADGYLYKVNGKEAQQVGYREFISQLNNNLIVNFHPIKGDYYFSDGEITYVLTDSGLARVDQHVMSVYNRLGSPVGLYSGSTTGEFLAVTDRIDFGYRGQKTIAFLEVGCSGSGTFSVAVDWRINATEAFQRTGWVELNNLQQAALSVAGNEFRLCLKCSAFEDVKVTYIKARFKMTDLRGIRGIYAPPPGGQ